MRQIIVFEFVKHHQSRNIPNQEIIISWSHQEIINSLDQTRSKMVKDGKEKHKLETSVFNFVLRAFYFPLSLWERDC